MMQTSTSKAPTELTCGQTLGGYQLDRLLHDARSAFVYRCISPAGDWVAIKTVAESDDRRAVLRLYQQAYRARQLAHPSLLPVLQASKSNGWHFIVMPLVEGGSLAHRVAAYGKLSAGVAVKLIVELARVVDVLHAAGIVHLALEPDHVLFDRHDLPILTGLSHSCEGMARDYLLRELHPPWSAPELLGGKERRADQRADVFGLAALLAFMLTGEASSVLSTINDSTEAADRLRSDAIDCSSRLADVIVGGLATDGRNRTTSAFQFARDALAAGDLDGAGGSLWQPLACTPPAANGAEAKWFVVMPSRRRDFHRMCRGSRQDVIRLLLRGRLSGQELAAPTLAQPFLPLERVPEFADAARFCAAPPRE